jgi:zinc transporter ZupT
MRAGMVDMAGERNHYISTQLNLQRIRASLIQKALAALYTATFLFISSSLSIAINMVLGSTSTAWIQTLLALAGGGFLLIASGLLLYESRFNLQFINQHLKFIGSLLETPAKYDK